MRNSFIRSRSVKIRQCFNRDDPGHHWGSKRHLEPTQLKLMTYRFWSNIQPSSLFLWGSQILFQLDLFWCFKKLRADSNAFQKQTLDIIIPLHSHFRKWSTLFYSIPNSDVPFISESIKDNQHQDEDCRRHVALLVGRNIDFDTRLPARQENSISFHFAGDW